MKCGNRPPHHDENEEVIVLGSVAGGLGTCASVCWYIFKKIKRMQNEYEYLDGVHVEEALPQFNDNNNNEYIGADDMDGGDSDFADGDMYDTDETDPTPTPSCHSLIHL